MAMARAGPPAGGRAYRPAVRRYAVRASRLLSKFSISDLSRSTAYEYGRPDPERAYQPYLQNFNLVKSLV
eukprot:SAG31_NODE_612_length_13548_cov_171.183285_6_plen_70_part_00